MNEDAVQKLDDKLDDLDRKVTRILALMDERQKNAERLESCVNTLKTRMNKIEREMARAEGRAAVYGVLSGLGTSIIVSVVAALIINHLKG